MVDDAKKLPHIEEMDQATSFLHDNGEFFFLMEDWQLQIVTKDGFPLTHSHTYTIN